VVAKMSDVEWDADDFEPVIEVKANAATDKWEGEDEDENVKDAWDGEDEGGEKNESGDPLAPKAVAKKKKRNLKDVIAEKEAKKKEDIIAKKKELEEMENAAKPENQLTEKLRRQQMQEEADLELAKEAFGEASSKGLIDKMYPVCKEDFDAFAEALKDKISKYEKSAHYVPFLETLFRDLCISLETDDIKRLSSAMTAVQNEKVKQLKAGKGKKKSKKGPSLVVGKAGTLDDVADDSYDLYDDFI